MLLYELFHPITGQGQGSSSFSRCFLCKFREKLDESSKSNASLMAASYSHSTYLSSWQCGIIIVHHCTQIQNWKEYSEIVFTGKYLSEALIIAATNTKYDKRLFTELQVQYMKTTSSEHVVYTNCFLFLFWHSEQFMYTTCAEFVVFMYWTGKSMNKLLSYCGLVDVRINASDKDLPV